MSRQKKLKAVFIHPDLGIGGAERLVLDVAVALANNGHEVSFVTNHFDKSHAFEELRDNKFPVLVIGDWIPRSICGICQASCAYLRMLYLTLVYLFFTSRDDKPDIYFVDQIPMAVPFIKWAGGKVIYYCHHPDLLASPPGGLLKDLYRLPINWLELQGTSYADVLLVNSKYTASVFRKTFPEILKEIQILYPTIASSYQEKVESSKGKNIVELLPEVVLTANPIVFLSINRYHPAKQLELALTGLEVLRQKISTNDWDRVHLIMAGGYDPQSSVNATYFSKLVNIAQTKDIMSKVTFLKSPSDDLKADLLLSCDCLIYTPVNEHFGIVPLEAMIASKPVIACNSGGPCETVEHEVTGFLCEPTADSLATFMSRMLDKSLCKKMGSLGKARQEKYFSYTTFTSSVNSVIENIVTEVHLQDVAQPGNQNESIKPQDSIVVEKTNEAPIEAPTATLKDATKTKDVVKMPEENSSPTDVSPVTETPKKDESSDNVDEVFIITGSNAATPKTEELFVNSVSSISSSVSPDSEKNVFGSTSEDVVE